MSVVAFVPSRDPVQSRAFFEGVLGLQYISDDPFAMVLEGSGVTIRVANVSGVREFKPAPFTILGWSVDDIEMIVRKLKKKGVKFERYEGMTQDSLDIWTSPSGA